MMTFRAFIEEYLGYIIAPCLTVSGKSSQNGNEKKYIFHSSVLK